MAQRPLNYSYSSSGYAAGSASPPPAGDYPQSYAQHSARSYYPPTSNVRVGHQQGPYYPPIAPAPPTSDRHSSSYRSSGGAPDYSNPSASAYSSQYNGQSAGYPYNPSTPRSPDPTSRQFIPTPSEVYAYPARPPRPPSAMQQGYGHASRPYPSAAAAPLPRSAHQSKGSVSLSPTSPSSSSGERFICEVCGKDFSRAHDRKRHHETQHASTPITHKCVYCEKDFSRADSLKRHIQNGCDEAPQ
ncbi:hypothetical protein GGX14DRAFT_563976 [Mycena pura]|uniref:C2H2-type domain-containing protein n=1 Tax=Mycena pura TaxID=153505 RepID=A0AAD6VH50_9AGAR|nr:hypothetical protein GGX14DRAFT_563976 [Mycena pura]